MNDKIGNLVNRVLTIYGANRAVLGVSGKEDAIEIDAEAYDDISGIISDYKANFDKLSIREALRDATALAALGNEIMSNSEPWALAKRAASDVKAREDFVKIVHKLLRVVFDLGVLLYPFTPSASLKILGYFGIDGAPSINLLDLRATLDTSKEIDILFSKITDKEMDKLRVFENRP